MTSEARAKLEEAILDYAREYDGIFRVIPFSDVDEAIDAYVATLVPDRDKVIDAIYYALPSADGLFVTDIHDAADAVIALLKGEDNAN